MKMLFLIMTTSLYSYGPDIPFVGYDKNGNPVVTEKGKCFKVIDSEYLINISCKKIVRKK